jgi:hypothetical protein
VQLAVRVAAALFLVALSFEAVPALAGAPLAGWLASAAKVARFGYLGAALAAGAALWLSRGIDRSGGVAVDRRSLFVGQALRVRRFPRWQVESATLVRGGRPAVEVRLSPGDVLRVLPSDPADARWLVSTLNQERRRAAADGD